MSNQNDQSSWLSLFTKAPLKILGDESDSSKSGVWVKLLLINAIIESAIMMILPYFDIKNNWIETAVDTGSLTLFSGFCIWSFILVPERKKAQKNHLNSTHFLRQQVLAMNEFAIVSETDTKSIITYANDRFCEISGYSNSELVGQNHRIIRSGVHTREFYDDMMKVIRSGKIWTGEICNKKKNGDLYWVDARIVPIFNSDGELIKFVSFRFDITEKKQAEKSLEQAEMKTIHLSRLSALGEMAGGIAHEINNPLAIISGHLALVSRKLKKIEHSALSEAHDAIEKVQIQVRRITKIIGGLRDFARSGDDRALEYVACRHLIQAAQDLCNEKLMKNRVRFETSIEDFELECNPIQIEQVLVNLIGNAIDAISANEEKWIRLESKVERDHFVLSITDSGAGIPEDLAQKIMQPFFTTKELGKGTGLGLSISHGIVQTHGGQLELDRQAANTRFVIRIPKAKSEAFKQAI